MTMSIMFLLALTVLFSGTWPLALLCCTLLLLSTIFNLNHFFNTTESFLGLSTPMGSVFIFLSVFILYLTLLSDHTNDTSYNLVKSVLCVVLVGFFSTASFFSFYILFEVSLIPTLAMIVGWGYQPERLQAGFYFMVYTVTFSLPLLIALSYFFAQYGTSNMHYLATISVTSEGWLLLLSLTLAFLVKMPLYGLHSWLPKAHVEAPLSGSMFLAGILLKMGGYGLYCVSWWSGLVVNSSLWGFFVCAVALWGMVVSSFLVIKQVDLKSMVAFSSVAHMSVSIIGLFSQQSIGLSSTMAMMIGHTLSSSAMFCGAFYLYKTINSRSVSFLRGLGALFPVGIGFWCVLCCLNMSLPPSLNFIGEFLVIPAIWTMGILGSLVFGLALLLSCFYNMFMYLSMSHGQPNKYCVGFPQLNSNQLLVMVLHMVPYGLVLASPLWEF